jgi:hypothetical protein
MRPILAFLVPLLAACTPTTSDDTGTSTSAPDTTSTSTSTSTETATTAPDPTTGEPIPGTTTDAPATTSTTSTTDLDTTATTGDLAFCNGWDGPDGPPFLDLYDKNGALLADGGVLPLECGAQGIFMFGLYPKFGGFTPPAEILDVDLVVDVDGFNNNPEGHFYSAHPVGYYIACDDVIGGVVGVLPIFALDNLDDLDDLDGKPAQIHVIMPTGDEPIAVDINVTLSVVKDASWGFCGG